MRGTTRTAAVTKLPNQRNPELVTNVNPLRTGKLVDRLIRADKELRQGFLAQKRLIIAERNPAFLNLVVQKVLADLMPVYEEHTTQNQYPHYILLDGKVNHYVNSDLHGTVTATNLPGIIVSKIQSRVKHPCSFAEKTGRRIGEYGRAGEFYDPTQLMVQDGCGLEIVVADPSSVQGVVNWAKKLDWAEITEYETHRKSNRYSADHLQISYVGPEPELRGLTMEWQITDAKNHLDNKLSPDRAHGTAYKNQKLSKPHTLGGSQLVLVGNSVQIPSTVRTRECDEGLIAQVTGGVVPYTLFIPRENMQVDPPN
ncbi:hypothetical protein HN587_05715 [Candidatus Woesearchaeota archaeon]|jgi:hypothetical protein|nr:hypothetical protein [Candidatus Woesearchaeota archaeon]